MTTINDYLEYHYKEMERFGIAHKISDIVMLSHIFEIVDKQISDRKIKERLNAAIMQEIKILKETKVDA